MSSDFSSNPAALLHKRTPQPRFSEQHRILTLPTCEPRGDGANDYITRYHQIIRLQAPRVFISYSHDSPEHKSRVLALADRLRTDGIDAIIDAYEPTPAQGWPRWMQLQIEKADFVLLICTATYHGRVSGPEPSGTGRGVLWEATLIYNALYSQPDTRKFLPVLPPGSDASDIPDPLKGLTRYNLEPPSEYERLYRHLTDQPAYPPPPLGAVRTLPALPRSSITHNPVHPESSDQTGIRCTITDSYATEQYRGISISVDLENHDVRSWQLIGAQLLLPENSGRLVGGAGPANLSPFNWFPTFPFDLPPERLTKRSIFFPLPYERYPNGILPTPVEVTLELFFFRYPSIREVLTIYSIAQQTAEKEALATEHPFGPQPQETGHDKRKHDSAVPGQTANIATQPEQHTRSLRPMLRTPGHGLSIHLQNSGLDPIRDATIWLRAIDRYMDEHREFTRNERDPLRILYVKQLDAGATSDGSLFAACDTSFTTMQFSGYSGTDQPTPKPLTESGIWRIVIGVDISDQKVSATYYFRFRPGAAPELVTDPRTTATKRSARP